jgi:acetoin utilization protein AcuB
MSRNVVSVGRGARAAAAVRLMKQKHVRRLPVLEAGRLVGIVTWGDLIGASPRRSPEPGQPAGLTESSPSHRRVAETMTRDPLTISGDATLEEAAVLMRDGKVGALPVVEDGKLTGILTESDVFDAFIRIMGLRSGGARLTIKHVAGTSALSKIVAAIRDCDAGILSLSSYESEGATRVVVRVDAPHPLHVAQTLVERGFEVTHMAPLPAGGLPGRRPAHRPRLLHRAEAAGPR